MDCFASLAMTVPMTSDRLFVYGTLMRGFDHPMAQLLSRSAEFIGEARCQGRLYLVKHYPGLVLSDDPADVVFGELYRLRQPPSCCANSTCTRLAARALPSRPNISGGCCRRDAGDGAAAKPGPISTTGRSPICRGSPRGGLSPSGEEQAAIMHASSSRSSSLPRQAQVELALDVAPFLGRPQRRHQFLESEACSGAYSNEVRKSKGLAQVATVIKLPRDRGQVFQAVGDMT